MEIKLWEVYLIRNRSTLNNTLSAYSLDGSPLQPHAGDPDRVAYRFLEIDWEKTIKPLLLANVIPYEVVKKFKVESFSDPAKKKVYVVEDDLETLFALNLVLEDAGYDVLLSHSARPLMEGRLPATDIFILDKSMPDGDGLELCNYLRGRDETRNTPVILISAMRNIQTKAMAAGVNEVIEKPLAMQDLLRIVSKYASPRLN